MLASSDPRGVAKVVELSRATYRKMLQNLAWATGYNVIALPLAAGVASQGVGDWTVDRTADRPMWRYRGKPVFVAADDQVASLPRATVALRP